MSLHDRIMGLSVWTESKDFNKGYMDGVYDSGKIAKEADELMAEMAESLNNVNKIISEGAAHGFNQKVGDWAERLFLSQQKTGSAIKKYKESTK